MTETHAHVTRYYGYWIICLALVGWGVIWALAKLAAWVAG
jgi:hypothetical protein